MLLRHTDDTQWRNRTDFLSGRPQFGIEPDAAPS
jgi:nuclear transport factor 2 (NTF2) superfamily protein